MDISAIISGADLGEWYPIPGTNVRVKITVIRPFKMDEIRERCRQSNGEVDAKALRIAMCEEAVQSWENINNKDGTPLPCTPENKKIVDDNWNDFHALWNVVIYSNADQRAKLSETKRKN